ncbi:MAG: hypothetical protein M3Y71_05285 [Actinomycetota bacterium]|nr:hypothetical protein [Actinomycetota bacterium]
MTTRAAIATGSPAAVALRVVTAAGLVVDAVIHLDLASGYQEAAPGGIGEGNLFRAQAVAALVIAVFVLVRGSRAAYLASAVVAASALAAVLLYRYVDLPALGPLPSMYEPLWFPTKTATAVAEAVALAGSLVGLSAVTRTPGERT